MTGWMWSEDGRELVNLDHVVSFGVTYDGSGPGKVIATLVDGRKMPVYQTMFNGDSKGHEALDHLAGRLGAIDLADEIKSAVQTGDLRVGDAGYETPEVKIMEPPEGNRRG